jgi:hypothetical protein
MASMMIASDVCFNFGKYKNRPVLDVLAENPGYVHWLWAGSYDGGFSEEILDFIARWEKENPHDARKSRASAAKAKIAAAERQSQVTNDEDTHAAAITAAASRPMPAPVEKPANWGTW